MPGTRINPREADIPVMQGDETKNPAGRDQFFHCQAGTDSCPFYNKKMPLSGNSQALLFLQEVSFTFPADPAASSRNMRQRDR